MGREQEEAGRTIDPQYRSEHEEGAKEREKDQVRRISGSRPVLRNFWTGLWKVLQPKLPT